MRAYRSTIVLAGLILLGWLWDLSLGGGVSHLLGWLLALIIVAGISGLSAWSRQRRPELAPAGSRPQAAADDNGQDWAVRPARPDELSALVEVEVAADRLFPLAGYGQTPGPAAVDGLARSACLLVIGQPPVGYARVEVVDGQAHLEGLSVHPRFMRRGRGSALVRAALNWAAGQGYDRMTLTTFADVPWNAPFYRRLGFTELAEPSPEVGPELAELRAVERRSGLDGLGRRIVMVRSVERLEP